VDVNISKNLFNTVIEKDGAALAFLVLAQYYEAAGIRIAGMIPVESSMPYYMYICRKSF